MRVSLRLGLGVAQTLRLSSISEGVLLADVTVGTCRSQRPVGPSSARSEARHRLPRCAQGGESVSGPAWGGQPVRRSCGSPGWRAPLLLAEAHPQRAAQPGSGWRP